VIVIRLECRLRRPPLRSRLWHSRIDEKTTSRTRIASLVLLVEGQRLELSIELDDVRKRLDGHERRVALIREQDRRTLRINFVHGREIVHVMEKDVAFHH
jgi:hypothetical protein